MASKIESKCRSGAEYSLSQSSLSITNQNKDYNSNKRIALFTSSSYHKLSENEWVLGCGATRREFWTGVTIAGQPTEQTTKQGKIELLSQWTMEG